MKKTTTQIKAIRARNIAKHKNRVRTTMMFVPGNNPAMIANAGIYGASSIMFDLEDAVALNQKDSARNLVYEALNYLDYGDTELVVRINGLDTPYVKQDVQKMVKGGINVIRIPKTETKQDVEKIDELITQAELKYHRPIGSTLIMVAIESAKGVMNAVNIGSSSDRLMGMAFSAEDYVTDMRTHRYPDGREIQFARNMLLQAARANDLYAFDTVFSDIHDTQGFLQETKYIHQLGYDGKSVINPLQIPLVNQVYAPSKQEIENAQQVLMSLNKAKAARSGVASLNGQMVDRPVALRAQRIMDLADMFDLVNQKGDYLGK